MVGEPVNLLLLSSLRISLRRTNELPEEFTIEEFEKYGASISPIEKRGGLRHGGYKDQDLFTERMTRGSRIQWDPDGNLESIEEEIEGDQWARAEGDIQQRFPVRIYSQKQIFDLATEPLALLGIVDEAPRVDRRAWNEKWRLAEGKFLSLRAMIQGVGIQDYLKNRVLRGELEDIKRKQKVFEQAGFADVLQKLSEAETSRT